MFRKRQTEDKKYDIFNSICFKSQDESGKKHIIAVNIFLQK